MKLRVAACETHMMEKWLVRAVCLVTQLKLNSEPKQSRESSKNKTSQRASKKEVEMLIVQMKVEKRQL